MKAYFSVQDFAQLEGKVSNESLFQLASEISTYLIENPDLEFEKFDVSYNEETSIYHITSVFKNKTNESEQKI